MACPVVSFVVPCYRLAHLLSECVESILSQSYRDFEILILDDCSPDNTPEVAQSFGDPRVKYIRNENNLGHLRNYNKGIAASRGKYIWLISADDRLRHSRALERYVRLLESHPEVGYAFCAGVGMRNGVETGILKSGRIDNYYYGPSNRIFEGRTFIAHVLTRGGGIVSASVIARQECYREISMFPLDMPHQGDTYIWFAWALEYDVAYIGEPLVNYRFHDSNMSRGFFHTSPGVLFTDELNVLWRTRQRARAKGLDKLVELIEAVILGRYANFTRFANCSPKHAPWRMTVAECEAALRTQAMTNSEFEQLRTRFHAVLLEGDGFRDSQIPSVQQTDLARRCLWFVDNVCRAGDPLAARKPVRELFDSCRWRYIDHALLANIHLAEARLCWMTGEWIKSMAAVCRAVARRPKVLGRPVKSLLREYKLRIANARA